MKDTSVLVVTPVFCSEDNQRLRMLLQNVYWTEQQSLSRHYHAVVDDGSTDETPGILDNLARRNKRLLVYHKKNGGSSEAINFGVKQSLKVVNPELITVIHSDDLLLPKSLESRAEALESGNAQFVYSGMLIVDELKRHSLLKFRAPHFCNAATLYQGLLNHRHVPYPTLMWKRDFFLGELDGFDPQIRSAEDWDIALRSAKIAREKGETHATIPNISVVSRMHAHNLRPKNIADGVRWQCYKLIFRKHVQGAEYYLRLTKAGIRMLREILPEFVKKPLRPIREQISTTYKECRAEEEMSFFQSLDELDYRAELKV